MYKLISFFLISVSMSVSAQTELNSKWVNDSTYALYKSKNWKALELLGSKALHQHIDFYYLRMRLGIACYEQQKYRVALFHFENAERYNSMNELTNEYLYYSYLFSGRYNEGERISSHFSDTLRTITHTRKLSPVNLISVETGMKFSTISQTVKPLYYCSFGINHLLARGYSLFHAYNYVQQQYYYGTYQQHQYYLSANIPLKRGFSLFPAFSVLYDVFSSTNKTVSNKKVHFLGSLNVTKDFPYAKVTLANSFSNFDTSFQIQHSLGLTVYPLANQRLLLGGTMLIFTDNRYKNVRPLFQVNMSFNFPYFFDFSATYMYARVRNFNLYNGAIIQNGYDMLNDNLTFVPEFIIKRRYRIYAAYQLEFKKEQTLQTNYISHEISLGTKIIF